MQGLVAGLELAERFVLIRQLGKGGMGEIWLAEDSRLQERVALKVLDTALNKSAGFVDLLQQECRKARGLVHPNIVRVYDFHPDDQWFFISMQYIDGETLVQTRGKPFQTITHQALMVCDALEYAHRAGIIHRDLKSSNVLRDQNGVCYLTDFGIASVLTDNGASGDPRSGELRGGGSLPSMSPQQLAGEPASVADDIYSLGALLYELLSGQPLFHPGVTPERIRAEDPAPLEVDGTGQGIPAPLSKVIQAMLAKSAQRRPAGVGAVRAVLEEVQADYPAAGEPGEDAGGRDRKPGDGIIKPVSRRTPVVKSGSTRQTVGRETGRRSAVKPGHSARLVYAGLAGLLLIVLGVIFFLPRIVQDRGPLVLERAGDESAPQRFAPEVGGPDPAASDAQRQIADEALGRLLALDDRLRAMRVELWSEADWLTARRSADTGDEAYRARDYAEALGHYREALTLMEVIELRAPTIFSDTLRDGKAAFEAGNQPDAIRNFEIAIAIDPANPVARAGLERAMRLDRVIELMGRATELENSSALDEARSVYKEVLALDPEWGPAREGFERTRAGIVRSQYERTMAAGFDAMARGDFDRARSAFQGALRARPGDSGATSALKQLDAEDRLQEIIAVRKSARAAEQQEQWTIAVEKYEAILDIDDTVISAKQDLARSRARLELSDKLDYEINNSDRFNEDRVARAANELLERARSIENSGPVLAGQIDRLGQLLKIAAIPVPVDFQSDNLTEVVIYKVGKLGTFLTRTMNLRPGGYVAVGSREGYRDVRRSFRVVPEGKMSPIVLSCEEPI